MDAPQQVKTIYTGSNRLVGKRWLDGHTTVGLDTSQSRQYKAEKKDSSDWDNFYDKQWHTERYYDDVGRVEQEYSMLHKDARDLGLISDQEMTVALGLSNAANPRNLPPPRSPMGSGGITPLGRRLVRVAAWYLEKRFGRKRLAFATLTLPDLPDEVVAVLRGVHWGELKRRWQEEIQRALRRTQCAFPYIVGVLELQLDRFAKHGVPMPHFHFCYVCKAKSTPVSFTNPWHLYSKVLRAIHKRVSLNWMRWVVANPDFGKSQTENDCMEAINHCMEATFEPKQLEPEFNAPMENDCMDAINHCTYEDVCVKDESPQRTYEDVCNGEWGASVDQQLVKKSVVNYLAKYISKGAGSLVEVKEKTGTKYLPPQWWYVQAKFKKYLVSKCETLSDALANAIYYGAEHLAESGAIQNVGFARSLRTESRVKVNPSYVLKLNCEQDYYRGFGGGSEFVEEEVETIFGVVCTIPETQWKELRFTVDGYLYPERTERSPFRLK